MDLRDASNIIVMTIVTLAVLLIGNYLGYKIGHWRLAVIIAAVALVGIFVFAVYAVVQTLLD
ncbi:MAG: hypothetical protein CL877_02855 [Dehalococcoidales bacterium]|jgi:hypothetical protein|nr:hypothetical protein [Dehalococcoidales bacterium]MDP6221906.1 hypothetical protein [Dehalococcoidales bacterium]MDP7109857.1 hypothetical protein [Dehalococcoidales bacterium]MDP7310282.1 hypothetical protein [Dehalococcoidales bacterium]MDP7409274.1 hypothetical protein [Dehalococcoidales bacterium]|tara:strand:+ start:3002 stop:3187 length:186 start_codon:yes stop_codon:yes gene_type:complete